MTEKESNVQHLKTLEQLDSPMALKLVELQTQKINQRLKSDPRFSTTFEKIYKTMSASDNIPQIFQIKDQIYNFWQDSKSIKGILRRTSVVAFNEKKPNWDIVLDLDQLSEVEKTSWSYGGIRCDDSSNLCMVGLSKDGKDAVTYREFNLKTKTFVKDGFFIPESKSGLIWMNSNTLIVSDGTNEKELSDSGYPFIIRSLKRGDRLSQSPILFKSDIKDSFVFVDRSGTAEFRKNNFFIFRYINFNQSKKFIYNTLNSSLKEIQIPESAVSNGFLYNQIIFEIKEDFKSFKKGSLLSVDLDDQNSEKINLLFQPKDTEFLNEVSFSKNNLWVITNKNILQNLYKYSFEAKTKNWSSQLVYENKGTIGFSSLHEETENAYFSTSDFLNPIAVDYFNDHSKKNISNVLKAPARFNSEFYQFKQLKAKSSDGTLVPYFIVYSKKINLDRIEKPIPTLMYGYGGFDISVQATYLNSIGYQWLEKGGIYVVANIRGGGEFGPDWHKAALTKNRHKSYQDFYAVAEDLINRKITHPQKLGIKGGSNGGLLTSVALTQKPELFNAVISVVPLANMLDFHKLYAGASWMNEYGDPENPEMRKYLLSYSPLHNLIKEKKYPEAFYITNTKDDRVHPSHARQMVARMQELGHEVLYNENTKGGHGRATNLKDMAEIQALEFIYLYQKLMD